MVLVVAVYLFLRCKGVSCDTFVNAGNIQKAWPGKQSVEMKFFVRQHALHYGVPRLQQVYIF